MRTHKLNFIKIENKWFVDFTETEVIPKINGVKQQHLIHLIGGWDVFLEFISNGSNNFWITISDSPILNGSEIKILDKPNNKELGITKNSVCYFLESYKGITNNIEFWSCSPGGFELAFGYLPKSVYFITHN
jgi:hypothetical protein